MKNINVINSLFLQVLGGVIFVVIFLYGYSQIDSNFYQSRDDGVITMSHAKNLVDYGFIGVNPSGGRIEAYSAPVQMFVYASAYALTGVDYDFFSYWQTLIAAFLLGFLFTCFFREKAIRGLLITTVSGVILIQYTSFLEWHGSGMENAITHVLFLGTLLLLHSCSTTGKINYFWSAAVFLATISRLDSVFHIAPLLIIYSIYWRVKFRDFKAFKFSLLVFILWAVYQCWRYTYFGDWLPNTAYAQNIKVTERLALLFTLNEHVVDQSVYLAQRIFGSHAGYLFLISLPMLFFVRIKDKGLVLLLLLICALLLTSLLNPFVFGATRLDYVRTTTQMVMIAVLLVAMLAYSFEFNKRNISAFVVFMAAVVFVSMTQKSAPYYLCCSTKWFESINNQFVKTAQQHSISRPTVANPDLGAMSWAKNVNVVDFGFLGSPFLSRLRSSPAAGNYFFHFAAPDIFETHGVWSCIYLRTILLDERFREKYEPVREEVSNRKDCGNLDVLSGVWIRKAIMQGADTKERRLIDDLQNDLSAERIADELKTCSPPKDCLYIIRSVYRLLPELIDQGYLNRLNEIFSSSSTATYDLYVLNSSRSSQSVEKVIEFIAASGNEESRAQPTRAN